MCVCLNFIWTIRDILFRYSAYEIDWETQNLHIKWPQYTYETIESHLCYLTNSKLNRTSMNVDSLHGRRMNKYYHASLNVSALIVPENLIIGIIFPITNTLLYFFLNKNT